MDDEIFEFTDDSNREESFILLLVPIVMIMMLLKIIKLIVMVDHR